jgi:hypothetical protein
LLGCGTVLGTDEGLGRDVSSPLGESLEVQYWFHSVFGDPPVRLCAAVGAALGSVVSVDESDLVTGIR